MAPVYDPNPLLEASVTLPVKMDPLSATAGCRQIITQCGECTVVLSKWMGQAKSIDKRLQNFYDQISALQLANENIKRDLELPFMLEAAKSTNDSDGALWSQLALTLEDCKKTVMAVNHVLENTRVGRFAKPIKALTESVSTGDLARHAERIQMFNVCLQLPLGMVTISHQLMTRDGSEATQSKVEENIFEVNTTIKTLSKKIKVLRPIYTNSYRQKSGSVRKASEPSDVDASIYEHMEDFVERSSNFISQAMVMARSKPDAPPYSFQAPGPVRRDSDWRASDQQAMDGFPPRIPSEMLTPAPSVRAQSPVPAPVVEMAVKEADCIDEDDVNLKLIRIFVSNGQENMDKENFTLAEENFREALEMLEENDAFSHPSFQPTDIILMLAQCCFRQDRRDDAINLLLPTSDPEKHKPKHVPDQGQILTANYELATIYFQMSAFADAEKYALKSFHGRRKLLHNHDPKTVESSQLVVDIYRKMGKEAKAIAYSDFLTPPKRTASNSIVDTPISPISRASTMDTMASMAPPISPPPLSPPSFSRPSTLAPSVSPPPFSPQFALPTRKPSPLVSQTRNAVVNPELNSSRVTVTTKTYNAFFDDDSTSSSLTTMGDRTANEPLSIPRHILKPKFLAIKSLSCDSRDRAVDMAMKLLKKYDPEPSKILIHRTDDLKRNIRKRGSDMGLAATGHGYAPIHFFCELSDHQATTEVELLIEEGVDLGSIRYKPGLNKVEPMIPLQIAIDRGHQDISRVIIEALSAQSQIGRSVVDINTVRDRDGMPPLLAACRRGQVRIVAQLLDYGATIIGEFPDMWYGNSLLHDACVRCDTDMVKLLLEFQQGRAYRRRDVGSITQEDKFGTTPLMYAAMSNNLPDQNVRKQKLKTRLACMRLLLEAGSERQTFEHDLRARDKKGKELFNYVLEEGDLKLRRLVEQFDRIGRRNAPPTELE